MITPRLRPRLEMEVALPPEQVAARLRAQLQREGAPCRGLVTDQQVDLRVHESEVHFWSPQLVIVVRPTETGSALVGHFGPNANLWTMFLACYGFVVCCAIFGAFYGWSQYVIDERPWALWSLPTAAVLVALIYIAAGIGQRLGRAQVEMLQGFLEDAVAGGAPEGGPSPAESPPGPPH